MSASDRMVFKWGENKDAESQDTGQGAHNCHLFASVPLIDIVAVV